MRDRFREERREEREGEMRPVSVNRPLEWALLA